MICLPPIFPYHISIWFSGCSLRVQMNHLNILTQRVWHGIAGMWATCLPSRTSHTAGGRSHTMLLGCQHPTFPHCGGQKSRGKTVIMIFVPTFFRHLASFLMGKPHVRQISTKWLCLLLLQYPASSCRGGRCQRSRFGTHSQQSQQWIQCLTSTLTLLPHKNTGNKGSMVHWSMTKLTSWWHVQKSRRFGESMVTMFQTPDQHSLNTSHISVSRFRTCSFNEASFSKRSLQEAVQRAFLGSFSFKIFKVRLPTCKI